MKSESFSLNDWKGVLLTCSKGFTGGSEYGDVCGYNNKLVICDNPAAVARGAGRSLDRSPDPELDKRKKMI